MAKFWGLPAKRLQSQLLIWTALILIVSVIITGEVQTRFNIRLLEANLHDRTETLTMAVDEALRLSDTPLAQIRIAELEERLRQFAEADRTVSRLDVVQIENDTPTLFASSSGERNMIVSSIPPTLSTDIRMLDSQRVMMTILPIEGTNFALVAVNSLENVDRYEEYNRLLTPAFAAILILLIVGLMYFMYRRTVSNRFDELLMGIQRAKEGGIANLRDDRQDEIGLIAKTLNELLTQVRSFNDELKREVHSATEDLNKRNLALEETTRQMVAMQHQLLQSERLATVGQMAATFAHEIGSPMSSLSAHVQLLLEDPQLTPDQRETLGLIRQQIHAVVGIVNELLQAGRRGPKDFVPTDINETIRNVIRLVQPKLMSQKIEVRVDLRPVPPVRGYPLYLQEAFINIINNASEAMPASGFLDVRSWYDEEHQFVNVVIADTGPGIDPSVVEHIFDRFVTTKAIGEGTGLGLGIVKEIVDSHRGTLYIAPMNGTGTAAHIGFPADSSALRAS